jgi:hypothetical protein
MLSSFGSRITSMVTQPSALAMAAGVLAGAIAGLGLVSAGIPFARPSEPGKVALQACPGAGPVLAHVAGGQTMLVTARSVDGRWLQVYVGTPGVDLAWGPAAAISLQAPGDGLPVGGCQGVPLPTQPPATPGPTLPPDATTSPAPSITGVVFPTPGPTPPPGVTAPPTPKPPRTPQPTPTPKPTPKPTPTPSPTAVPTPTPTPVITPTPDTTPPSITGITITNAELYNGGYYIEDAGNSCGTPSSAKITATITDSGGSGIVGTSVRLHYWDPNGGFHDIQMGVQIGTSLWGATVFNNSLWDAGEILYSIAARDNAGNSNATSYPPDSSHRLYKGDCIL